MDLEIAGSASGSCGDDEIPRCSGRIEMCCVRDVDSTARTASDLNRITGAIITAAIEVHRALGSGLLESAYRRCLAVELTQAGLHCEQKRPTPLVYKGVRIAPAYEADIVVDGCVIVEVKAVTVLHEVHERQLLTYLRIADCRVGLLLNFGGPTLRQGIRRIVNDFPETSG